MPRVARRTEGLDGARYRLEGVRKKAKCEVAEYRTNGSARKQPWVELANAALGLCTCLWSWATAVCMVASGIWEPRRGRGGAEGYTPGKEEEMPLEVGAA